MQQLSSSDAMYVHLESPTTPLQLAWLNIYDPATAPGGKVQFEAILEHVERRLHLVRFFRQRLAMIPANLDEPYWVDDDHFDLEYHVVHVGLPAPGDWRQLCNLVGRLFARPLNMTKPLWQFYVIEGLDNVVGFPKGSFALLAKMHHAAIDGVSGVDVTTALHTSSPNAELPPPPAWKPEFAPTQNKLMQHGIAARLTRPRKTLAMIGRILPVLRSVQAAVKAGELDKPAKHKVPKTRFGGPVGPHRVVDAVRFQLNELRPVRGLVAGATVNDVLLAIIGGALRRYLVAKKELPEESLLSACPISLRPAEQRGQFGNLVGNMFATLATDTPDPVERLRRIKKETAGGKGLTEKVGAKTIAEMSQLVPGALMGLGMRISARLSGHGGANTTLANVPGPQSPLYLAGARVVTQFCIGPVLNGMGVFHAAHSYCGEITLTIVADRDKMPDPEFYAQCIGEARAEMLATTAGGSQVAKTIKRRRAGPPKHSGISQEVPLVR